MNTRETEFNHLMDVHASQMQIILNSLETPDEMEEAHREMERELIDEEGNDGIRFSDRDEEDRYIEKHC